MAFFSQYTDFVPKDEDVLIIDDDPKEYRVMRQTRLKKGKCVFEWRSMGADEWVAYQLSHMETPMEFGKFLVPEVAEHIGITIEHLRRLEPVAETLDERHSYERIIYESYISNGSFALTQAQRDAAYEEYKKARQ